MNSYLDIIPTPKTCEYTIGGTLKIKNVCIKGEESIHLLSALGTISTDYTLTKESCADLIIAYDDHSFKSHFCDEETLFFTQKYAAKQGYIIKKDENKPIVIGAKTDIGCMYALMTLVQILDKNLKSFKITDYPDFKLRGNTWTIWAESGGWSFDFGDGVDAIKSRIKRLLDMNMRYKINAIYMDGFGLSTDRFPEYADIMRYANDEGRKRGIKIYTGAYLMSYGQQGSGTFQGNTYLNRKSYPDGEIYECIGSYMAYNVTDWVKKIADYSTRLTKVEAREHGTCLSNYKLLDLKVEEMVNYIKKTHAGGLYLHNMDGYEIHPELWKARCENCRQKWPDDSLFTKDGAAGAFAEYFNRLGEKLACIKDGDYDASQDLSVTVISPGYGYAELTNDEDYDTCMKFWGAVSKLVTSPLITIGFREQFFYHDKNVRRTESIRKNSFEQDTMVINFSGGDGFYDDHILAITAMFNYMLKGYDGIIMAGGTALQEPMQVFNAEYLWSADNSGFYNVNRPDNQKDFVGLYHDAMDWKFLPRELFENDGFIDKICVSLYGKECGKQMSAIYKMNSEDGAHPILSACCRTIFTHSIVFNFDMSWDNKDFTENDIIRYKNRFYQCAQLSEKAVCYAKEAAEKFTGDKLRKKDIEYLAKYFKMGAKLCTLLDEYMEYYYKLDKAFRENTAMPTELVDKITSLIKKAKEFKKYIAELKGKPLDFFDGAMIRSDELADFLEYQPSLMLKSIETKKRIPDDRLPWKELVWW